MALPLFYNQFFLAILLPFSFMATTTSAHDSSKVGYTPDDLTSIDKQVTLFQSWIEKHKKTYNTNDEKLRRFQIFQDNLRYINDRNMVLKSYRLGLNAFTDLSNKEFKKMYTRGLNVDRSLKITYSHQEFNYRDIEPLPTSINWTEKGAVTDVKDQGQCGAGWVFSAVAAVEGINQIMTDELIPLSEQEVIDCNRCYNMGCNGGLMTDAFTYIVDAQGLNSEVDYPYIKKKEKCRDVIVTGSVGTISGFCRLPHGDEKALLKAVAFQPVSVGLDASSRDFQNYKAGIFHGCYGTDINHAVTVVGYHLCNVSGYFILKNSWGKTWGESGYMKIKRDTGNRNGTCGMYLAASFSN